MSNRYIDWNNSVGLPDGRIYFNNKCLPYYVVLWKAACQATQRVSMNVNSNFAVASSSSIMSMFKTVSIVDEEAMDKLANIQYLKHFINNLIDTDTRFMTEIIENKDVVIGIANSKCITETNIIIEILTKAVTVYKEANLSSFGKKCLVGGLQAPIIPFKASDIHTKYVEYLKSIKEAVGYDIGKWGSSFTTNLILVHIK